MVPELSDVGELSCRPWTHVCDCALPDESAENELVGALHDH